MINSFDIQSAKEISIEAVAQRLGFHPVRRKISCISRDHNDKNPSLSFDPRTNRFKCFGCDLSGDVIAFVQIVMGYDFVTTMEWLLGSTAFKDTIPVPARQNLRTPRVADVVQLENFWKACDRSQNWLEHKGLDSRKFQVGKVTAMAHSIIPEFPVGGLFVPYIQHGKITYGRWRNIGSAGPRFLGLPGVDTIFYNQDALSKLDGTKPLYLAEGETDTMSLHTMGLVAVGFPGATQFQLLEVIEIWVTALGERIPKIVLAFDDDEAGRRLEQKVLDLNLPVPITNFDLEGHNDVNDYYRANLGLTTSARGGHV